jgi:hypothetical protein
LLAKVDLSLGRHRLLLATVDLSLDRIAASRDEASHTSLRVSQGEAPPWRVSAC